MTAAGKNTFDLLAKVSEERCCQDVNLLLDHGKQYLKTKYTVCCADGTNDTQLWEVWNSYTFLCT